MDYTAHPTAVIDGGCTIGKGTRIWHFSHIMPGCVIGENCNIGQNVVISPGVILGRNVKVQNNVSIYTGVECEDDVFLGPSMVFTNVINPRSAVNRRGEYLRTLVRTGASIGANATIVCGHDIGGMVALPQAAIYREAVTRLAVLDVQGAGGDARQAAVGVGAVQDQLARADLGEPQCRPGAVVDDPREGQRGGGTGHVDRHEVRRGGGRLGGR